MLLNNLRGLSEHLIKVIWQTNFVSLLNLDGVLLTESIHSYNRAALTQCVDE